MGLLGVAASGAVRLAVVTGHIYTWDSDFFERGAGIAGQERRRGTEKLNHRVADLTGERERTTNTMRLLLLDTETNGLPKNRYAPIALKDAWPAILQLSWAIYDLNPEARTLATVATRDIGLALHPDIPWDTGAAKIHGLSEVEARHGTAPAAALLELADALQGADCVIAHNLEFDRPVIRAAAWAESERTGDARLRSVWPTGKPEFCTMRQTQNLVRLPSPYYGADSGKFKPPKLNELYAWLYGHVYDISGATLHSAKSDTHCLAQCILGLVRKGHLIIQEGRLAIICDASA